MNHINKYKCIDNEFVLTRRAISHVLSKLQRIFISIHAKFVVLGKYVLAFGINHIDTQ